MPCLLLPQEPPTHWIRALRNNPRITHANLGSEDLLRKLGSAYFARPSADFIARITIYLLIVNHRCLQIRSACATARSIVLRCRGWASCFACAIVRGFFAAEGRIALRAQLVVASFLRMAELLRLCDRSWVCCHGWLRFGCAILDDCVWIRCLRAQS